MNIVSTYQLLKLIYKTNELDGDTIKRIRLKGILEEYDIINLNEPIDRKSAARIVHGYIRIELNIPDLSDISKASVLRDLYDCRICVNHIAQVYLRGLMEGKSIPDMSEKGFWIFDSKGFFTQEEASILIDRLKDIKTEG